MSSSYTGAGVPDDSFRRADDGLEISEVSQYIPDPGITNADELDVTLVSPNITTQCFASEREVSKSPWGKMLVSPEDDKVSPSVLGAMFWPDLTEARGMKIANARKINERTPNLPRSSPSQLPFDIDYYSGLRSLHLADGPQYHQGWRHSPVFELQQPTKHNSRMQEMDNSTSSQLMNDSLLHDVNYGGGFPNQNKKWRDIRRRGNFEWPNHGRGNGKGSDVITVLDEQHIGQRNMHWPPQPPLYMNTSFAFLNGVMHYVPIGVPVPVQFIPHFHPVVSPDIMVPANMDLKAANSALIKQINYYFSEENLMKDCYLREHMDGEGFVPISLIARFNRHDRIRRRNDGGKWRLQPGQRSAVLSVEDNISLRNLREGFHRETEQACNGGLTSSLEESMAQTSSNRPERAVPDAGSTPEKCEHINHNGESVLLDAKKGATALLQHFPGSGSSIQRSSFIDDNTVAILASHELATREVST